MMVSTTTRSPKVKTLTGQYYLNGVAETESGLKFNADRTFNFFYSYGSIDRSGSGTYTVTDDTVLLNSTGRGEKDFNLVKSGRSTYNGITIKIIEDNPMLVRYVACAIATPGGLMRTKTNDKGFAQFAGVHTDNIILIHLLFPDRTTMHTLADKSHNYFEFTIEPAIVNVFFNNLSLKISGNELTGGHPLIAGNKFHYVKEK